jgi:predicted alpha/beta-fold hydrolase
MARDQHHRYRPPFLLRNPHLGTIVPALLRKVKEVKYERERFELEDGDFMDLDWSRVGGDTLLIIVHGLEGSSDSQYMRGLARIANQQGWDTVAINLRNCSGEANRLYSSYHSGKSDDLLRVVHFLEREYPAYQNLLLSGFSLGGNISLKFAGEQGVDVPSRLQAVVAVSVPTNLKSSAMHLQRRANRVYLNRFLRSLKRKAAAKKTQFPDAPFTLADVRRMRNFTQYDNLYTAPAHGFRDAEDYWNRCASGQFIPAIRIPTLVLNALDDPFLPKECYPHHEAGSNPHVTLETPRFGGHVGFATDPLLRGHFWQELRIVEFFKDVLGWK